MTPPYLWLPTMMISTSWQLLWQALAKSSGLLPVVQKVMWLLREYWPRLHPSSFPCSTCLLPNEFFGSDFARGTAPKISLSRFGR
jgi:hypothetical protein